MTPLRRTAGRLPKRQTSGSTTSKEQARAQPIRARRQLGPGGRPCARQSGHRFSAGVCRSRGGEVCESAICAARLQSAWQAPPVERTSAKAES